MLGVESADSRSNNGKSEILHSDFIFMLTVIETGSNLKIIGANGLPICQKKKLIRKR